MKLYNELYKEHLDRIKSQLLYIDIQFRNLKKQAEVDHQNGELSTEDYGRILKMYITDVYPERLRNYAISDEDRELVKQYGQIGADGGLLLDALKPKFQQKLDVINEIYKTIIVAYYFYCLDEVELRKRAEKEVRHFYESEIASAEKEMNAIKEKYGPNYTHHVKYGQENSYHQELSYKLTAALKIIQTGSQEEILDFMISFYQLSPEYFNWFRYRLSQEHSENAMLIQDHVNASKHSQLVITETSEIFNTYDLLTKRLMTLTNLLMQLSYAMSAPKDKPKKSIFNNSNKTYTKDQLYDKINQVFSIPGALEYIRSVYVTDDDEMRVDVFYQQYYEKMYGEDEVTVQEFERDFYKTILNYINRQIADIKLQLEEASSLLAAKNKVNISNSRMVYNQASEISILAESSRRETTLPSIISKQDEEKIYGSIRDYFASDYKHEYLEGASLRYKRKEV